jgi:hypothetical protein
LHTCLSTWFEHAVIMFRKFNTFSSHCKVVGSADETGGGGELVQGRGARGPKGDPGPRYVACVFAFLVVSLFVDCTN